jgi:hypothetical protein
VQLPAAQHELPAGLGGALVEQASSSTQQCSAGLCGLWRQASERGDATAAAGARGRGLPAPVTCP